MNSIWPLFSAHGRIDERRLRSMRTPEGILVKKKSEPKQPSRLGLEIEAAIERAPRYVRHRENILYLCTFRTTGGTVFGVERVTINAINLWVPP